VAAGEAKADVDREVLQGAALRWLGEDDDVIVETSDESNETDIVIEDDTTPPPNNNKPPPTDDKVIVGGSMELSVEDPEAFCADSTALGALKAAIATAADVPASEVKMQCTPTGRRLGEEAPAARRLAGTVTIDYTVPVTSEAADFLGAMDTEAWTTAINAALQIAGIEGVTVLSITAPSIKEDTTLPKYPKPDDEDLDDSGAVGMAFPAMSLVSVALAVLMPFGKQ